MSTLPSVPLRTCVGCRGTAPKASLIRVVRTGGELVLDPTGAAPGRGAYLHGDLACVEAAHRRGGIARALHAVVGVEERSRLTAVIERELRHA